MNTKLLSVAAAVVLIGSTALVQAQSRGGTASSAAPGHQMQSPGGSGERSEGPAASGFSPGHDKGKTGAGDRDDRTTGFGRDTDDRLRGDRDDRMMDNDRSGIDKE